MRGTWQTTSGGGGGGWGAFVGLGGVVLLGVVGYRAADSALAGLRESAGAANVALAWGFVAVLAIAALVVGGWVLLGRRREVAQRPEVEAHDRAMAAAEQQLALERGRPAAVRATARRVGQVGGQR